jgi:opacity protein-like surface antigen
MTRKLAAFLALFIAMAAHAQTPFPQKEKPAWTGFYAGGLFGRSEAKAGCIGVLEGGGRTCDPTDTAFGFFGGLQMHRYYGAEIGYTYLGKMTAKSNGPASASTQSTDNSIWDAAAVGYLPLDQILPIAPGVSAYARLGGYRATLTASEHGVADHTNLGLAYGAGLQADIGPKIGLRLMWQRYKNVGGGDYLKQNYDVLGLGAFYRFQ